MYLFIDIISPVNVFILFENKIIIKKKELVISGKEFDEFFKELMDFLNINNKKIDDLEGISIINGPGGFTGTRIISLVLNTIQFIKKIKIHEFDYFYFLEVQNKYYPMIIKANRQEYLIKENNSSFPVLSEIGNILDGKYNGIGNILDFENRNILLEGDINYDVFIKNYNFSGNLERVEPYYIKKPSIT